MMKKIIALLIAILLLLSACSSATLDGAGKELEDTIANATDADNKYVQMVKGGYRTDNPDVTYEDAFSAFFGTPRWKYFESEDGQDVVEFTGDCAYQNVPVKARIQFVVDEENGTFEASYLAFNEVPQDALTLAAVISKAFEQSEASDSNGESNNFDSDGVYYGGKCLNNLLGKTSEEVSFVLGAPTGGTPVTGELLYGGTEYWTYNDELALYFDNSTVMQMKVRSETVTWNGEALNITDSEIYDEFGEPSYERFMEENEEGDGGYTYIEYLLDGFAIGFEILDASTTANNITLSLYDSEIFDEEYQETTPTLDNDLCGRWRSYDGSALTLESSGYATTVFRFWNVLINEPNSITWEASNGRLTLYAYTQEGYYWIIGEGTYFGTETDRLYLNRITSSRTPYSTAPSGYSEYYDVSYSRVKTSKTDLAGAWDVTYDRTLTLNSDGTGQLGSLPMTWEATETELYFYPVESRTYDYTVSGNTLTIFFNDGAKVYTKVGD